MVEHQVAAGARHRQALPRARRQGVHPGPFGRILVGDLRLGVEDLQHALARGRRLLARRDDVAHGLDRPDELQRQRDERHQAAEGQRTGADRDRAEHDDQADDGVRDQIEQRPERAEQARLVETGRMIQCPT